MNEDNVKLGLEIDYVEQGRQQVEAGLQRVKKVLEGLKHPLKDAEGNSTRLGKSLKGLASALKRIIIYKGIRTILAGIASAFKTGLTDIYHYSEALGGLDASNIKGNMDKLATSILYVKNALGASLAPIIQSVTPLFVNLADACAAAANKIAAVFAYLQGKTSYTAAKKFGAVWDNSLSSASKSAKDLKRTLMGFDEINKLDAPDTGNGGSGYTSEDYGNMFEEREIDDNISEFGEKVKEVLTGIKAHGNEILRIAIGIATTITTIKVLGKLIEVYKVVNNISSLLEYIGLSATQVMGIIAAIGGALILVTNAIDAWKNGLSSENIFGMAVGEIMAFIGVLMIVPGTLAPIAAGITLLVGGIVGLVVGVKDLIKNGDSLKAWGTILVSIGLIFAAVAIAFGAVPAAIIAGIALITVIIIRFRKEIGEFFSSIGKAIKQAVTVDVPNAFAQLWASIKKLPSDLKNSLKQLGSALKSELVQPFVDAFNSVKTKVTNFLKELKSKFAGFTANIKMPHVTWTTKPIEAGTLKYKVLSALGLPTSLPYPSVSWYAKGGIVDGATLIGAGEAGAEAIVPLENNTQWLDMIADRLIKAQSDQNIVLNVDGKQLFDIMVGRNNSIVRTSGRSPLLV